MGHSGMFVKGQKFEVAATYELVPPRERMPGFRVLGESFDGLPVAGNLGKFQFPGLAEKELIRRENDYNRYYPTPLATRNKIDPLWQGIRQKAEDLIPQLGGAFSGWRVMRIVLVRLGGDTKIPDLCGISYNTDIRVPAPK
jgi:hypothetical protein